MGAARRTAVKPQPKQHPSPDINVTPLVDVCLVLLIIFMVIAPALNDGAQLELPKVLNPDPKPKEMNSIELALAADGTMVLEDQLIKAPAMIAAVTKMHAADPERSIILKIDENVKYKKVREIFADMQKLGFKGILLKVIERKKAGAS